MKLVTLVSTFTLLALSSQASSAFIAGQNDFWAGSQMVTTGVYSDGKISLEVMNKDYLASNGYTLDSRSVLKDEWAYQNKAGYKGTITVNRRKAGEFDSVVIQNQNFDKKDWTDLSVFGEGNTLLRRTVCEERRCFVISKNICEKVARLVGKDSRGVTAMQAQCADLSTAFKTAMEEEKKAGKLDSNFADDVKKIPSNPIRSRNIVMGDDINASAKNLYSYLSQCESLKRYNQAEVIDATTAAPGNRSK